MTRFPGLENTGLLYLAINKFLLVSLIDLEPRNQRPLEVFRAFKGKSLLSFAVRILLLHALLKSLDTISLMIITRQNFSYYTFSTHLSGATSPLLFGLTISFSWQHNHKYKTSVVGAKLIPAGGNDKALRS